MTEQRRVILFEDTDKNTKGAESFGAVITLFPAEYPRSSVFSGQELTKQVLERLHELDYNPRKDYLCITGNVVPIANLIAAAASFYGEILVLVYDKLARRYVVNLLGTSDFL